MPQFVVLLMVFLYRYFCICAFRCSIEVASIPWLCKSWQTVLFASCQLPTLATHSNSSLSDSAGTGNRLNCFGIIWRRIPNVCVCVRHTFEQIAAKCLPHYALLLLLLISIAIFNKRFCNVRGANFKSISHMQQPKPTTTMKCVCVCHAPRAPCSCSK